MNRHSIFSKTVLLAIASLALPLAPCPLQAGDAQPPEVSFITHTLKEENVEGPDVERTYFVAAGRKIVYGVPKGCRLSAGDGFLLLPTDAAADWEIHVNRSPFIPVMDLTQNVLQYRDSAEQGTPRGATELQVEQPQMNPYPYNGWKSLGFTWTYSYYGRPMVRTVGYVNLEVGVQVMVTTIATKGNAEKAGKLAKEFMSSWWVKGD